MASCGGGGAWEAPPAGAGLEAGLRLANSLTPGELTPLRAARGRTLRWYTCGPTVYDVAHMGHARAYLTFDILRRVVEDYFGYSVLYQMNITDIDDKIILRARRNKLVADFGAAAAGRPLEEVSAEVRGHAAAFLEKRRAKAAALAEPLPAGAPLREKDERETLAAEAALKAEQAAEILANVEAATGDLSALLVAGQDPLAEALDAAKGHEVNDPSIFDAHARRFEEEFHTDMDRLGVRPADSITRVSEFVPEVVAYIERIIERGLAYAAEGSVYFDTRAFQKAGHTYRKLVPFSGQASEAEMAEGEGALGSGLRGKRHPNDFALWKASKPGEPEWDSPWGRGRPGWHIECSVMASEVLGERLDIHAGGCDLKFPHHDNELAQAEAFYGSQQWVNYFLHAGHLHIRGLKMSKSLKNFITIQQALEEHSPRQLRLMFLLQKWDKPMLYSDQAVSDARNKEALFKNFFGAVKALLRGDWHRQRQPWRPQDRALSELLLEVEERVHAALCENVDTPEVMAALCDLVTETNKYLTDGGEPLALLLRRVAGYVTKILGIFGVVGPDEIGFQGGGGAGGQSTEALISPFVGALVQFRDDVRGAARAEKSQATLEICDGVRDGALVDLGIRVEDRAGTASLWKMDDPATLRREMEEKRAAQREAERKKSANKLEKLKKDLAKWQAAAVAPADFFKTPAYAGKFSELNADGFPIKNKEGEDLNKSQTKAATKDLDRHSKAHKQLLEKGDPDAFLSDLAEQVKALSLAVGNGD